MTSSPRPSPSIFACIYALKNWTVGRAENEALGESLHNCSLLSYSMKMGAEIRVLTWRMSTVPPVGKMKVQRSLTQMKTTLRSQKEDQNQVYNW